MIGRKKEIEELERAYESDESEFVAVYGRRRVGKTFLVRETFNDRFVFSHTGIAGEGRVVQLRRFRRSILDSGGECAEALKDWFDAFDALKPLIKASPLKRKVVFIDEMPWMDTQRSGFVSALEAFWNGWANMRTDVLLIVCGSSASWIVKNLFRNHGGLHNRVTIRIALKPFSLGECERFAESRGLRMSRLDIVEAYMALGGIPYYWKYLDRRFSLAQNIDRMFFADAAPLRFEFDELYSSLFGNSGLYKDIVGALATKKAGMTRGELLAECGVDDNGALTKALEVLEQCGFIRIYNEPRKRKKNSIHQLVDSFTLFHFRFLDGKGRIDPDLWTTTSDSHSMAVWRGIAFERVCLLHFEQIRHALGIAGVHVNAYAWSHRPDDICREGAQIDLVIDRSDRVVNVCEMKFSRQQFAIEKEYEENLRRKLSVFRMVEKIKGAIHLTFITAAGLLHNAYWNSVQSEVTLDDLFKEV